MVDTMGALREGPDVEAAIVRVTSNNQVCLKAALAVARLLRHVRHLAASLQSADAVNATLAAQNSRAREIVGSPIWHDVCSSDGRGAEDDEWPWMPQRWDCGEVESRGTRGAAGGAAGALGGLHGHEEGAGSCGASVVGGGSADEMDDATEIMPAEAVEQTVSGFLDAICQS